MSVRGTVARNVGRQLLQMRQGVKAAPRRLEHHDEGGIPFENLPIKVKSRYSCTLGMLIYGGTGLWLPWVIVWYGMTYKTL